MRALVMKRAHEIYRNANGLTWGEALTIAWKIEKAQNANEIWVYNYLNKKGRTLETLEAAINNMTKNKIVERFGHMGVVHVHTKNEMLSIVLSELQNEGYAF